METALTFPTMSKPSKKKLRIMEHALKRFQEEQEEATIISPDQMIYRNHVTGQIIVPTWTHVDCGGTIYITRSEQYRCRLCGKRGTLGVDPQNEQQAVLLDPNEPNRIL